MIQGGNEWGRSGMGGSAPRHAGLLLLIALLVALVVVPVGLAFPASSTHATYDYDADAVLAWAAAHELASPIHLDAVEAFAPQRVTDRAARLRPADELSAPRSALDDGVTLINGRRPINSSYAGRVCDGAGWTDDLAARYPGGVRFNDAGFPDFSPYARARTQSDNLTGVYRTDAAAANQAVGLPRTPSNHVWHHVEDGRTMILIPQDIHDAVRHTGGAAVIRGGG